MKHRSHVGRHDVPGAQVNFVLQLAALASPHSQCRYETPLPRRVTPASCVSRSLLLIRYTSPKTRSAPSGLLADFSNARTLFNSTGPPMYTGSLRPLASFRSWNTREMGTSVRLLTTRANRALVFAVVHQKDDGLGKVWIAQIAAGHQKPAHGEIVGLAECRHARKQQKVRRGIARPYLILDPRTAENTQLQCSWRFSE